MESLFEHIPSIGMCSNKRRLVAWYVLWRKPCLHVRFCMCANKWRVPAVHRLEGTYSQMRLPALGDFLFKSCLLVWPLDAGCTCDGAAIPDRASVMVIGEPGRPRSRRCTSPMPRPATGSPSTSTSTSPVRIRRLSAAGPPCHRKDSLEITNSRATRGVYHRVGIRHHKRIR